MSFVARVAGGATPSALEHFTTHVRPLLVEACLACHGGEKVKGGLDLSTRDALLKGGDSGPAIEAGKPARKTLLLQSVTHEREPGMPYKKAKLSAGAIAHLQKWIDEGAPYDRPLVEKSEMTAKAEMTVTVADRAFWAFLPLKNIESPAPKDQTWPRNAIDRFVRAAQEAKGLSPADPADRRTLIRRATFDLTGLPPTPAEVHVFVNDPSPAAFENLVDRLLAAPAYGERWGRHWLDVARYADSEGYEGDKDRPNAYAYRDFVIRALNADMPFDQFVRWQLAGDEYQPDDMLAVAATGFCAASPAMPLNSKVPDENLRYRYDDLDNVLATTGSAMLGLTIGCARCHDHKFDPIPTRDYYRMITAFVTTERRDVPIAPTAEREAYRQREAQRERRIEALRNLPKENKTKETQKELKDLEDNKPAPVPIALILTDAKPQPDKSFLMKRGDPTKPGEQVGLGFLTVLTPASEPPSTTRILPPTNTTHQRRALADWMTDPKHGAGALVARVIVNRLWHHHFGQGLVRNPGDFGQQGDRPSHPELLECLANELVRNGWRLKPIHRLIMTSATYQQTAHFDPAKAAIDPDNRLLWLRRPFRLEAEALRDSILFVSGGLDAKMFGLATKPYVPAEAMAGRNKDDKVKRPTADGPEQWRRSVYLWVKRSIPTPLLDTFDAPAAAASCSRRTVSTVATQSLALLNDPFVRNQAKLFATRIEKEGGDATEQVKLAHRLALGRNPTTDEQTRAVNFLNRHSLVDLCQVLFLLNEFAYVD